MKSFFYFLFAFLLFQINNINAQSEKAKILFNQANLAFDSRNFTQGFILMQKAIDKDPNFPDAYFKLATVYQLYGEIEKSVLNYEKAVNLNPDNPAYIRAYTFLALNALQNGDYDKCKQFAEKFLSFKPTKQSLINEAQRIISICDYSKEAMKNPLNFKPVPLNKNVNKLQLQYFPVLTADQQTLIFTGRSTQDPMKSDENLFVSEKVNGDWSIPHSISPNINTANNEGTCSISADGRTMVFTCCQGRQGYGSCDLFVSEKKGGEWSEPENLGPKINTMAWESQPSLSADGRMLYFVSDRSGGIGKRDIWMSVKDDEGYWSSPVNLGKSVNTTFDDLSPFIHVNGKTLYFSSAGHLGFGGYDLFSAENEDDKWVNIKNLGYPVNDYKDQVSLFVTSDGKKGYYAYEEMQGRQRMNSYLYEFDMPPELEIKYKSDFLKGVVYDSKTKLKLEAKIELFDVKTSKLQAIMHSDPKSGEYLTVLTQGSEYALYINKPGYLFKSLYFNFLDKKERDAIKIDIYLQPIEKGAKEILNNLFFATNEYKLDNKSKTEIDKIVRFMNEYQKVVLEISGHTDDVDTDDFNQKLSEKRAKSVYDYLLKSGIAPLRLTYKGYGEKQPTVANDTDANKAINRRIEFKVLQK